MEKSRKEYQQRNRKRGKEGGREKGIEGKWREGQILKAIYNSSSGELTTASACGLDWETLILLRHLSYPATIRERTQRRIICIEGIHFQVKKLLTVLTITSWRSDNKEWTPRKSFWWEAVGYDHSFIIGHNYKKIQNVLLSKLK